jgi:hypothetical protein
MGYLAVVIPPDILNDNESTQSSGVAVESGTITLRCYATGVPEPKVLWRREDGGNIVLREDVDRERQGNVNEINTQLKNLCSYSRHNISLGGADGASRT